MFGIARAVVPGAVGVVLLTFPIGIGMGLAGAMLPVAVKERFSDRPGFATGVYTAGITIGAAVAAAVAVPLAHAANGWRTPLLVIGAVSTALAALWLWLTRSEPAHIRTELRPLRLPLRNPLAWRLVTAFFLMSFVFYGLNSWLPDVYVERGWSQSAAGGLLAVMNTLTIPVGFVVAWLADHRGTRRMWLAAAATLQLASLAGVVLAPSAGWLWAVLLGAAIGPLFPLTMTLPLDAAEGPAEVAALAGMMLGLGYTLSSTGAAAARRGARRLRRVQRGAVGARRGCGAALARRRLAQPRAARSRSIVCLTPSASGVHAIGPIASSSGAPSNSSGNGQDASARRRAIVTPGTAASIARAASAIVDAGPPRWKARAPSVAARAAAMKTRAVSGANWSCVRPPKAIW